MSYRDYPFRKGCYYHVYCRGNEKKEIFLNVGDYERFLKKLEEYKTETKISIICYCLMPNHFHLLLRQDANISISVFAHKLLVSYSMYFNKRYERVGHLFQGRFKARLVRDEAHMLHLSRYIHLNPIKITDSIREVENYLWSSYPEFLNRSCGVQICEKEIILINFQSNYSSSTYQEFVNSWIGDENFSKMKSLIMQVK